MHAQTDIHTVRTDMHQPMSGTISITCRMCVVWSSMSLGFCFGTKSVSAYTVVVQMTYYNYLCSVSFSVATPAHLAEMQHCSSSQITWTSL
jgi:hypothetical protein